MSRKTSEQLQAEKSAAHHVDTLYYRIALNAFIDTEYTNFLERARKENDDYSLELFKTGRSRVLRGRNYGGKRPGGGWVIPLFTVDVNRANETLNKELTYSRGGQL